MAARKSAASTATRSKVTQEQELEVRTMQKRQQELAKIYKAAEKVEVSISPMYQPHFGKVMPVILNGIPIYIPCDGRAYKVPKQYASIIKQRIRMVDDQIQRTKSLSDVSGNIEQYAGQKQLIQRA